MSRSTQAQIEAVLSWMADIDPQLVEQAREKFGLTAAAEAGKPNPVLFLTKQLADKQRELAATIERCAQVAEQYDGHDRVKQEIAAAIRALKDQT